MSEARLLTIVTITTAMLLAGCLDGAAWDYRRCKELEEKGEYGNAAAACEIAHSKDPKSHYGQLAKELLPKLLAKQYEEAKKREAARPPASAAAKELPQIAFDGAAVTEISVSAPEKPAVVLKKSGEKWQLSAAGKSYEGSAANVASLLKNLGKLEVKSVLDKATKAAVKKHELDREHAIAVVVKAGSETVLDIKLGKSGSQGQAALFQGQIVAIKGFSKYLYSRDLNRWRDNEIWSLEDNAVSAIEIESTHGKITFTKAGDKWSGTWAERVAGQLGPAAPWTGFDERKVASFLQSYKRLRAQDFAAEGADTGLTDPLAAGGGRLVLKPQGEAPEWKLTIGKPAQGKTRYAQAEGNDTVFVLSEWIAGWTTAGKDKFIAQPKDKPDTQPKDKPEAPPKAPPELPGPPAHDD